MRRRSASPRPHLARCRVTRHLQPSRPISTFPRTCSETRPPRAHVLGLLQRLQQGQIMKTLTCVLSLLVCGAMLVPHARAQTRLIRQVIGSGATAAASASNRLGGTIGQTIIGRVSSSSGTGRLGFWYTYQTAGPGGVDQEQQGAVTGSTASLRVSPNPATDRASLAIRLTEGGVAEVLLYSGLGSELLRLFQGRLETGTTSLLLPINELASGNYLIVLVQGSTRVAAPLSVVK